MNDWKLEYIIKLIDIMVRINFYDKTAEKVTSTGVT